MKHIKPRTLISAVAATIALAGCSGGLVAPEDSQSNAFLNQIGADCGHLNIGSQPIGYLLTVDSDDTYFIDETSKLSAGEIDRTTYANDINSFYPAGDNSRALDCIFGQLE